MDDMTLITFSQAVVKVTDMDETLKALITKRLNAAFKRVSLAYGKDFDEEKYLRGRLRSAEVIADKAEDLWDWETFHYYQGECSIIEQRLAEMQS